MARNAPTALRSAGGSEDEMVVIYIAAWIVVLSIVGILYVSGINKEVTFAVSAFLVSTRFWMGLTVVLPWLVNKMHEPDLGKKRR